MASGAPQHQSPCSTVSKICHVKPIATSQRKWFGGLSPCTRVRAKFSELLCRLKFVVFVVQGRVVGIVSKTDTLNHAVLLHIHIVSVGGFNVP